MIYPNENLLTLLQCDIMGKKSTHFLISLFESLKTASIFLGSCFIRTDQLDGETDWKLKLAIHATQALDSNVDIFRQNAVIAAEKPHNDIHSFMGSFTMVIIYMSTLNSLLLIVFTQTFVSNAFIIT